MGMNHDEKAATVKQSGEASSHFTFHDSRSLRIVGNIEEKKRY
jgi:hypothetical protein